MQVRASWHCLQYHYHSVHTTSGERRMSRSSKLHACALNDRLPNPVIRTHCFLLRCRERRYRRPAIASASPKDCLWPGCKPAQPSQEPSEEPPAVHGSPERPTQPIQHPSRLDQEKGGRSLIASLRADVSTAIAAGVDNPVSAPSFISASSELEASSTVCRCSLLAASQETHQFSRWQPTQSSRAQMPLRPALRMDRLAADCPSSRKRQLSKQLLSRK